MVREFEETPNDNLTVLLDAWLPGMRNAEDGVRNQATSPNQAPNSDSHSDTTGSVNHLHVDSKSDPARSRLEDAVSLAATICWEWCQENGNRLAIGIADKNPVVLTGESGPDLRRRLLRALSEVNGHPDADVIQLVASMRPIVPPGPILVLTTSPGNLRKTFEREFHRPVTCIHVPNLAQFDFFEW